MPSMQQTQTREFIAALQYLEDEAERSGDTAFRQVFKTALTITKSEEPLFRRSLKEFLDLRTGPREAPGSRVPLSVSAQRRSRPAGGYGKDRGDRVLSPAGGLTREGLFPCKELG